MITCDVCVIGAGLAGLTAAVNAAEKGLTVVVLEQASEPDYLCNSRMTGGAFHVCLSDILSDPDVLEAKILAATGSAAHPKLARAVAEDARRAVRWLQAHGIRFIKGGAEAHHNFVLSPPSLQRVGSDWKGRGGDVLLRSLGAALEKAGGRLLRGHRAKALRIEDDVVCGLVGQTADESTFEVSARAVVIADGGFQCDRDLLRENIAPSPGQVLQRNARSGLGDGLKMARAAGAKLSSLMGFYGHVLHRNAMNDDRLWPLPWMDDIATTALVINGSGQRLCDEGRGGVYIANRIAAQENPVSAFVVFDQKHWEGPGKARFLPPNPHMEERGGPLVRASSIEELAEKIGVPAQTLKATVEGYNTALETGGLAGLTPPRTSETYRAQLVSTPPFLAAPVCAGVTYTMGGVAISEWSQAMHDDGSPFVGLYAVGGSSGGLEGGDGIGYVGGLAKAATTGLRASEHIVRQLSVTV